MVGIYFSGVYEYIEIVANAGVFFLLRPHGWGVGSEYREIYRNLAPALAKHYRVKRFYCLGSCAARIKRIT